MRTDFSPPERLKAYPSACPQCGGRVEAKKVTLIYLDLAGEPRVVRGVPAGVCRSCGERYLTAAVTERIEELLAREASRIEPVPTWDFAAAS
jgi:YgiT-type zinc finger domain-containing protein